MSLGRIPRLGLTMLALFVVMSAAARGVTETFAVFLLPVSQELAWTRAEAASIYALLMLCLGLFSPVAGRLFDRFGPAVLFPIGMACLTLGPVLASRLEALWQFYLCLSILVGFGAASLGIAVQSALLSRWFAGSLTTAIAVVSGAAGVGVMTFSPFTQVMIEEFGWRDAYLGIAALVGCLGLIVLFAPWRRIAAGRPESSASAAAAATAAPAWTFHRAVRSRPFWALFAVHFLTANSMFAVQPQVVAFLVEQGFDPILAASAFGVAGISATVGLLCFGVIADRFGALISVTLSYGLTMSSYGVLFLLAAKPSLFLLWTFVIAYGASFGSRGPVISALTARIFGRGPDLGLIMGAIFLGMGAGAAMGATVGGLIRDFTGEYFVVIVWSLSAVSLPLCIFWFVPELKRAARRH